jgi:hypothetical protein
MALLLLGISFTARTNDCSGAGFTDALECSKCVSLASFVKDQGLVDLCGSCCKNDTVVGTIYKKAKLEVCK